MTAQAIPDPVVAAPASAGERAARARALLAGAEGRLGIVRDIQVAGGAEPSTLPPARTLPLADEVAPLLPGGVLRRGTAVSVQGSTSLVLSLISRASRDGSWAAILGMPHVGVVAAARRGVELGRLALIPHPGTSAAAIAGACLDGMDIVVLGPRVALSEPERRRLASRARERGAVIVSAGPWSGAHVALEVAAVRWEGLGAGEGRLRSRALTVRRSGRHLGAPDRVEVVLDVDVVPYPGRQAQARRSARLA